VEVWTERGRREREGETELKKINITVPATETFCLWLER